MDESKKRDTSMKFEERQRSDFGKKAWMHTDNDNNVWVTYGMPERAQSFQCKATPRDGTSILQGSLGMLGRAGWSNDYKKNGRGASRKGGDL
jgi:hypothetical protein